LSIERKLEVSYGARVLTLLVLGVSSWGRGLADLLIGYRISDHVHISRQIVKI
jgi:hypothetical protein